MFTKLNNKIDTGFYVTDEDEYLVVTPEKTKTFGTYKRARHYFRKWMKKD